ncbi:restriction modification system DNA specificity domain protein [Caldicellulosiruptor hydrothermalis 108]|uniref:Restriction modification system DNA specificity domain protein n=1 Tax=Caldicellulosiruptor hydrothermalis (strain DSM 18901 / VKM B-2411 / 108) TaxID=632292 RepID=E4QD38_CALH1|nr:restriction endonuclease subunit S [Caldicellulosiruptor hydrothermalis]ADQ07532.1 restriction modification system DNA specificity domain protein [Caldicellulosiruptor hydrothermalis 108]
MDGMSRKNYKFKDSPLGRIPEEWEVVRLGDIAKIKTGNSNVQDAAETGDYLFFDRSGEIKRSNRYLFDKEAVIVPGEGTEFLPKYYCGKFDLHQRAYAIFDFSSVLSGEYLFYAMHKFNRILANWAVGTTVKSLRLPMFENLLLLLPPLPEQRKIAEILETIDNAIEKTDAIIEKYKRIKQGLMQDLLTKGVVSEGEGESERWRLRDENIDKFKDSPLGRIPEEWKICKLDHREITIMITDGSHYSPQPVENSEYYIVNIENIINGKIEFETCKKISPKDYKKLVSNKCNPKYGDVLFTKDGTVGITLVFSGERNVVLLSSIAIIRPSNCLDSYYLKYSLETEQIKKQIDILIGGSVLKRIVLKDIKSLVIFIPPIPEQQRIASILSQIDEAIEKERAYKEKLERIKKGLMEDLLTGKVRVNHLIEEENKDGN